MISLWDFSTKLKKIIILGNINIDHHLPDDQMEREALAKIIPLLQKFQEKKSPTEIATLINTSLY